MNDEKTFPQATAPGRHRRPRRRAGREPPRRQGRAPRCSPRRDATAKSLGYVADAKKVDPKANPNYKPGQHCANCMQYTGKAGAAAGPCNIFPGKDVAAAGWCKVWVLKPGAKAG